MRRTVVVVLLLIAVAVIAGVWSLASRQARPAGLVVEPAGTLGAGWLRSIAWWGDDLLVGTSTGPWLADGADVDDLTRPFAHPTTISALAVSGDGRYIASGGWDNAIVVYDSATQTTRTLLGHTGDINALAFMPDAALLVSGSSDKTVRVWDVATGELLRTLGEHDDSVLALAVHPAGELIATAGRDAVVRIWQADGSPSATLTGHDDWVTSLAFSPEGAALVTGSRDGQVIRWGTATWRPQQTDVVADRLHDLALLPTGDELVLAVADDGRHQVRRTTAPADAQHHRAPIIDLALHAGGERLASISHDGSLVVWDVAAGAPLAIRDRGHAGPINHIAFSPDGARLVAGGGNIFTGDTAVRVWDVATRTTITAFDAHTAYVKQVAIAPDNRTVASADHDGRLLVWDAETGALQHDIDAHAGAVLSLAFSPDGALLASGGFDARIHIWDVATGARRATFESPGGPVRNLLIDFDGDFSQQDADDALAAYALASDSGGVALLCGHGDDIAGSSFSADGTLRAASNFQNAIEITDARTGEVLHTLDGHTNWVDATAFDPQGRLVASGSYDMTVRLWDARTGAALATLTGHTRPVNALAFSPAGDRLASAGEDGTVRLWRWRAE